MNPLEIYLRDIRRTEFLTHEEEAQLARKYAADGDQAALWGLVVSRLPLVVRIAEDYRGRGRDILDLIQEGTLGLWKAARAFDPDRKSHFGAYAARSIRGAIRDAIVETTGPYRVPVATVRRAKYAVKISAETAQAVERARSVKCFEPKEDHRINDETPERPLERAETIESIRAALEQLDPRDRTLAVLGLLEEVPGNIIARQVGMPHRTVNDRMKRIRIKLRKVLEPVGVG